MNDEIEKEKLHIEFWKTLLEWLKYLKPLLKWCFKYLLKLAPIAAVSAVSAVATQHYYPQKPAENVSHLAKNEIQKSPIKLTKTIHKVDKVIIYKTVPIDYAKIRQMIEKRMQEHIRKFHE